MTQINILLVDDETLLTDSLEIILNMTESLKVIGKASDGLMALELLKKYPVDLALVDLNMKRMGGIELILHIKNKYPSIKVLVLTTFYDEANIKSAIKNGADGYLLKDSGRETIIHSIHQVMCGQSVLDHKVMQTLSKLITKPMSDQIQTSTEESSSPISQQADKIQENLTKRESQVCQLIAEGYTNSQISKLLHLSEGTVKNYISTIYDKLDIHDRTTLALFLSKRL